jgi:hypothetical protein
MIDATKFPKAARLQQQREEQYAAEQARQKAEKLLEAEAAKVAISPRQKRQQDECKAAETKVAKKGKPT